MARILFVGDSPEITSGFGVCNRMFIDALIEDGHDVVVLACLMTRPMFDSKYKMWYVDHSDPMGHKRLLEVITIENPDIIVMHGDPGTLYERMAQLMMVVGSIPVVGIYPIEGEPLHRWYIQLQTLLDHGLTYTHKGADLLADQNVQRPTVQSLGWNHADFKPISEEVRIHLRTILGLNETFLVGQVAYNKRGNRQPAVIHAAKMLEDESLPITFYLHTSPDEGVYLQGWPLNMVVEQVGATNLMFKPEKKHTYEGVSFHDNTPEEEYLKLEVPKSKKEWVELFASLPLGIRMNLFDLYIDNSSVQGYNLPSAEAMACGVPLISVNDGLARTEIFESLAYDMFEPDFIDWWHTTAKLVLVSPEQIAEKIKTAYTIWKEEPERWKDLRAKSRQNAVEHLQWDLKPLVEAVNSTLENKKLGLKQKMFYTS